MKFSNRLARALAALVVVAVLLSPALLTPAKGALAKGSHHFDFTKTTKPWDSRLGSGSKDASFGINNSENGCPTASSKGYAAMKFSVKSAGGVAWMVAPLQGYANDIVEITYDARSADLCPGCKPVVYVGATEPTRADQFQAATPAYTDPQPVGDWETYQYPSPFLPPAPVKNKGTIYVAIGFAIPSGMKSPSAGFGLDCVDISIYPAP